MFRTYNSMVSALDANADAERRLAERDALARTGEGVLLLHALERLSGVDQTDDGGDIYAEGVDELIYGRLSNVL